MNNVLWDNKTEIMISKLKLGELIRVAGREKSDEEKAERFLQLIRMEA